MSIDISQLITDMKDAATTVLGKDVSTIRGFSKRQVEAIAQQAVLVEAGIANGQIQGIRGRFLLGKRGTGEDEKSNNDDGGSDRFHDRSLSRFTRIGTTYSV